MRNCFSPPTVEVGGFFMDGLLRGRACAGGAECQTAAARPAARPLTFAITP